MLSCSWSMSVNHHFVLFVLSSEIAPSNNVIGKVFFITYLLVYKLNEYVTQKVAKGYTLKILVCTWFCWHFNIFKS